MKRYIRVECYDKCKKETVGGFFSAMFGMLARIINMPPDSKEDEIIAKAGLSNDPEIQDLLALMFALSDIPRPDIYTSDRKNYFCLYTEYEFHEEMYTLEELNDLFQVYAPIFTLVCKEFYLEKEEIVYSDPYQIVITRECYERHSQKCIPRAIESFMIEMEEMFDDCCDDDDE